MSPDPIAIRVAELADAEQLTALMRSTFIAAYGHSSSPQNVATYLDSVYFVERQREEITDPDVLTLLVAGPAGGELAGFAQLRFATMPPPCVTLLRPVELGRIYLSSAFHGQGLAAALMQRLVEEAMARGGDGLWLSAWTHAPQAIRYYSKSGFHIAGTAIFTVGDDPKEDWLMVREFASP